MTAVLEHDEDDVIKHTSSVEARMFERHSAPCQKLPSAPHFLRLCSGCWNSFCAVVRSFKNLWVLEDEAFLRARHGYLGVLS